MVAIWILHLLKIMAFLATSFGLNFALSHICFRFLKNVKNMTEAEADEKYSKVISQPVSFPDDVHLRNFQCLC